VCIGRIVKVVSRMSLYELEEARFADFPRVCLPILGFRKMYSFLLFLLYFCFQIPIDSYDV